MGPIDWPRARPSTRPVRRPPAPRCARRARRHPRDSSRPTCRPSSPTSSARQHRLRQLHARPASTRSAAGSPRSWSASGATRRPATRTPTLGDTVVGEFRGRPGGRRGCCSSATWTRCSTRRHRRGAAVPRRRRRARTGPASRDMKGGLLTGLYAAALGRSPAAPPASCRSSGSRSSPTRTRRSARRPRPRSSASSPAAWTRASCSSAPAPTATSCSSRKGIVDARITIHGRAAHAGVEPEKGRSAILAAAASHPGAPRAQRALAGRDLQRRASSTPAPGRTSWPRRPSSRSTCGRSGARTSTRPWRPSGELDGGARPCRT